jgi:hypothetical protein
MHTRWEENAGIRDDGTLWAWAARRDLKSPHVGSEVAAVQIGKDKTWKSLVDLGSTALLLDANGAIWRWDRSTAQENDRLKKIDPHSDWIALTPAWWTTLALAADGSIWSLEETHSSHHRFGPFEVTLMPSRRPAYLGNIFDAPTLASPKP